MSEPVAPNPLPPRSQPVFDDGSGPFTIGWYRALRQALVNGAAGITQLIGDVLAGPGGGVQTATLSPTGVTPGSYTSADLTVDIAGRIRAISNGSPGESLAGFGFEIQGIIADNEQLGFASWPVDVTFTANTLSYLNCFSSSVPTSDASFQFLSETLTVLGTAEILAGTTTGPITWTTDPYTHLANTFMLVHGPTPADPTLGNVNALVVGKAA